MIPRSPGPLRSAFSTLPTSPCIAIRWVYPTRIGNSTTGLVGKLERGTEWNAMPALLMAMPKPPMQQKRIEHNCRIGFTRSLSRCILLGELIWPFAENNSIVSKSYLIYRGIQHPIVIFKAQTLFPIHIISLQLLSLLSLFSQSNKNNWWQI